MRTVTVIRFSWANEMANACCNPRDQALVKFDFRKGLFVWSTALVPVSEMQVVVAKDITAEKCGVVDEDEPLEFFDNNPDCGWAEVVDVITAFAEKNKAFIEAELGDEFELKIFAPEEE